MRKISGLLLLAAAVSILLCCTSCGKDGRPVSDSAVTATNYSSVSAQSDSMVADKSATGGKNSIVVKIGEYEFEALPEDSVAATAFVQMLEKEPLVLEMKDYGGFEKTGTLEANLPADDRQITTEEGDIVLYNKKQIVMFYGSNSWSYTPVAKVVDLDGWQDALKGESVTVTFYKE